MLPKVCCKDLCHMYITPKNVHQPWPLALKFVRDDEIAPHGSGAPRGERKMSDLTQFPFLLAPFSMNITSPQACRGANAPSSMTSRPCSTLRYAHAIHKRLFTIPRPSSAFDVPSVRGSRSVFARTCAGWRPSYVEGRLRPECWATASRAALSSSLSGWRAALVDQEVAVIFLPVLCAYFVFSRGLAVDVVPIWHRLVPVNLPFS